MSSGWHQANVEFKQSAAAPARLNLNSCSLPLVTMIFVGSYYKALYRIHKQPTKRMVLEYEGQGVATHLGFPRRGALPNHPQLPSNEPWIPPYKDQRPLNRGTSAGKGVGLGIVGLGRC